jgi:hypothetical protein
VPEGGEEIEEIEEIEFEEIEDTEKGGDVEAQRRRDTETDAVLATAVTSRPRSARLP